MPDRENWTAAMVLKWVLIRDEVAVLGMPETYGVDGVFADGTVHRLVPEDIDAVSNAYCTVLAGEQVRTIVLRHQRVLAAKDEIYQTLRRGELEARARRNGAGDVETIAPNQWLGLKFRSWHGHDLAMPINVEQDALKLSRAFEDYIDGGVTTDILPTVWPDPHFAAEQVRKIWPAFEQTGGPADAEFCSGPDQPHRIGLGQSTGRANRATSGAQTKCETWLRQIGADELVQRPKPCWRSVAKDEFPGLSGRGFDRAWGNVAAEFPKISKAGAKPKNKI
jgi:hypothetical protein